MSKIIKFPEGIERSWLYMEQELRRMLREEGISERRAELITQEMEQYHGDIYRAFSVPFSLPSIGLTDHQAREVTEAVMRLNEDMKEEVMRLRHDANAIVLRLLVEKHHN